MQDSGGQVAEAERRKQSGGGGGGSGAVVLGALRTLSGGGGAVATEPQRPTCRAAEVEQRSRGREAGAATTEAETLKRRRSGRDGAMDTERGI